MMLDYLDHSARSACKAWGIHLVAGLGSQLRWTMVKNRQRRISRTESARFQKITKPCEVASI